MQRVMSDFETKISELSPKRAMFVREYLIDLNATQAATRAGYSARTAGEQGARLLADVRISSAIELGMSARAKELGASAEKVLRELYCMAHFDPGELALYNVSRPACIPCLPEHLRRAIIGWSWDKFGNFVLKLSSKTAELTLLGKHLNIWKDVGSKENPLTGEIVSKIERVVVKPSQPA